MINSLFDLSHKIAKKLPINQKQMHKQTFKLGLQSRAEKQGRLFLLYHFNSDWQLTDTE